MRIFTELLFLQGHITQPAMLREEQGPAPVLAPHAGPRPAPRLRAVAPAPGTEAVGWCS